MLTFHIVTLFPEFFASPLQTSLLGKAAEAGLARFVFHNPRDFAANRHRHVDDRPFGGGPGMVMQLEPLCRTLRQIESPGKMLLMSPAGCQFDQSMAMSLARENNITLICGRYEGVDARLGEIFPIEETSLCDAVLNGGETAALAVIEAVSRLLPDFMGKDESSVEESFSSGLLEYPHYTRPEEYEGHAAPQILLSGHHAQIRAWRRTKSLEKTLLTRPELLARAPLTAADAELLASLPRLRAGRNISFCLFHYPVYLESRRIGTSSLTNLDIHDIARISRSYGMGPVYVFTPIQDQIELLNTILEHWLTTAKRENSDRARALRLVKPISSFAQLEDCAAEHWGKTPAYLVASAKWPDKKDGRPILSPAEVRGIARAAPVLICLGTARGLAVEELPFNFSRIRPLRFLDENHLPVRGAAAILADRILGDFY